MSIGDASFGMDFGSTSNDDLPTHVGGMKENPVYVPNSAGSVSRVGNQIGRYVILKSLGAGGMGDVYLARQVDISSRLVAIKVLKKGLARREFLHRFERERQAIASLNHTNIAKLYDFGSTLDGLPYFVMEYVEGNSITDYCDANELSIQQRLDLFSQACRAINHSHQRGVIHRDLKPSNILVSTQNDQPIVKVIDFGVSKLIEDGNDRKERNVTSHGRIFGTVEYMSPEQAEGDSDLRTDIFSLGAILFQLLAGSPMIRCPENTTFPSRVRLVSEFQSVNPSSRVRQSDDGDVIACKRKMQKSQELEKQIKGDLDWIVVKATNPDRELRYNSAIDLADDVKRFLQHEPVLACPPSVSYRLGKLVKKHQLAFTFSCVLLTVLLGAALGGWYLAWWALDEAAAQREATKVALLAKKEAEDATKVAARQKRKAVEALRIAKDDRLRAENSLKILSESFYDSTSFLHGRNYKVDQVLDIAVEKSDTYLQNDAVGKATLLSSVGRAYLGIGFPNKALKALTKSLKLYDKEFGEGSVESLKTRLEISRYHRSFNFRSKKSLEFARKTLQIIKTSTQTIDMEDQILAKHFYATMVFNCTQDPVRKKNAINIQRELIKMDSETGRPDVSQDSNMGIYYARMLIENDQNEEAIQFLKAYEGDLRRKGRYHGFWELMLISELGNAYAGLGNYKKTKQLLTKAIEIREKNLGNAHPNTMLTKYILGKAAFEAQQYQDTIKIYQPLFENTKKFFSPNHKANLGVARLLGGSYLRTGRPDKAGRYFDYFLKHRTADTEDEYVYFVLMSQADVCASREDRRGALEYLLAARAFFFKHPPRNDEEHFNCFRVYINLSNCYVHLGEFQNARRYIELANVHFKKVNARGLRYAYNSDDLLKFRIQLNAQVRAYHTVRECLRESEDATRRLFEKKPLKNVARDLLQSRLALVDCNNLLKHQAAADHWLEESRKLIALCQDTDFFDDGFFDKFRHIEGVDSILNDANDINILID